MATEIQTHDFEKAKNQIKTFAKSQLKSIELEALPTAGGFLGLGAHRVTGEEINERLIAILSYIATLNNTSSLLIKEFNEVYNALEALDKDYIQAILISIKASERNSEAIKAQQENLQSVVKAQSQMLKTLVEFKNKFDEYGYLSQIDDFLDQYKEKYKGNEEDSINSFQSQLNDISNFISDKVAEIDELLGYINHLKLILHLEDIDKLWEKVSELSEKFENSLSTINSIKAEIDKQKRINDDLYTELEKIHSITDSLEKVRDRHQNDIYQANLILSQHSKFNEKTKRQIVSLQENNEELVKSINKETQNRKKEIKDLNDTILIRSLRIHKQFIVAYVIGAIGLVLATVALFV